MYEDLVRQGSDKDELEEIKNEIQRLIGDPGATVPYGLITKFASSQNLSVLGALAYLIQSSELSLRVVPPLSRAERQRMLETYWRRCIFENPADTEFIANRYVTALEVLNWFRAVWDERSNESDLLSSLKLWMADLYMNGSGEVRLCITQGILETLLQHREIRHYFGDWKDVPQLWGAYNDATR